MSFYDEWDDYELAQIARFREQNRKLCDYTRIQADESGLVWVAWDYSSWMIPFKIGEPYYG